jgi:protease I
MTTGTKDKQESQALPDQQDKQDKKIAIVVADGFEQVELTVPRQALLEAGFTVDIISPKSGSTVQGYNHTEKGDEFPIDVALTKARPDSYAGLVLPGGVHNPDELRHNPKVLEFVRHFFAVGKPVASICHGPWTLIDAGVAAGRRLTSWASIKTDLSNAGAQWVDEAVVSDRGLVTSRGPQDLPAFCKKMLEEFKQAPSAQEAATMAKLGEMIKNIKVAMLTTRKSDGSLHSCPMMTQGKQFDRILWFFTARSSAKGDEIAEDQEVNLSYADPGANRYVSVSGRAKLVRDRAKAQELWTPAVKAWFPRGLDDPELALLQVSVERAEYWDAPASSAVTLFQLAKSLLTGRPYQGEGTEHERLELESSRSGATARPPEGAAAAPEGTATYASTAPPQPAAAPGPSAAKAEPTPAAAAPRTSEPALQGDAKDAKDVKDAKDAKEVKDTKDAKDPKAGKPGHANKHSGSKKSRK